MRALATVACIGIFTLVSGSAYALCPAGTVGPLQGIAAEGALVGGPVEAAVRAATSPPRACAYAIEEEVPPAISNGPAVIDEPLLEGGVLRSARDNRAYVTAYVDGEPVLVDPETRAVVDVME